MCGVVRANEAWRTLARAICVCSVAARCTSRALRRPNRPTAAEAGVRGLLCFGGGDVRCTVEFSSLRDWRGDLLAYSCGFFFGLAKQVGDRQHQTLQSRRRHRVETVRGSSHRRRPRPSMDSMNASGVLLIIAASFGGLGAVFWLVGFAVGRGRRRGWVTTNGRWSRFRSGLTRSWQVEYTVDGTVHRIMPLMNAATFSPSGEIPVSYDPAEPRRAVIDTFYHRGGLLKVLGAVVVGIAVALAIIGLTLVALDS